MQVTQEFASHGDRTIEKLSLVTGWEMEDLGSNFRIVYKTLYDLG
jgi:hypothetical protein